MQITIGKLLGLFVALAYPVILFATEGGITGQAFGECVGIVVPLALIWFPDGSSRFFAFRDEAFFVTVKAPAISMTIIGWFFLIALPVTSYLAR